MLEDALEQTAVGNGQVVGVVAEAGTGKSRLCFELAPAITLGEFAEWWLTYIAERERRNYWRKATSYVRNIILPILGKRTALGDITTAKIKLLQDELLRWRVTRRDPESSKVSTRTIRVKTARNIVTSYFRSMIVEAMERHRAPAIDPFPANLRWPKERVVTGAVASDEPDPFEASERDRILEWYRQHKAFWYPFLHFQFWTGCRPSETAALREADVDLEEGTVRINKSRDEGEDNEPKTRGSKRMIKLYPNVVDVLTRHRATRMHPRPDDFFFARPDGEPLHVRDWPEDYGFYDTLRRLKIRQRVFYCTRDTSISWQLTKGANPWGVAKYHGTSLHNDRAALRQVHPGSRPRPGDHRGARETESRRS
jgi:integrase